MEKLNISRPSNISEAWWTEVCKKLKNSVVFIEDCVAESLHWVGGLQRLLNSGCKDVKEFSSFETCRRDDEKAVFLLGGLISGPALDTIRDIIKSSKLKYVIVVTGAHPSVHAYAAFGGRDVSEKVVMDKLEQQILEWLGNLNYTVEIFYFPLILVPPTEDVFLLPHFHNLVPLFEDDIPHIVEHYLQSSKGDRKPVHSLNDLELEHLPHGFRVSVLQLVSCLHSYLQGMSAREEIYSVGHLSRVVAGELEAYSPARRRRKVAANKVSLVFVDRALDLVSPTSYDSSVLMSRILNALPRLPGHKVDSAVDLSPLSLVHPSCDWTLMPGNFAHPSVSDCAEILEKSINSTNKDTIQNMNQKIEVLLKETEGSERQDEASPAAQQLARNVNALLTDEGDQVQESFGVVQQALAILEAAKPPLSARLDQLYGVQKMLLQSFDDEQAPLSHVLQLLKTREKKGVKVEEVLAVLVYVTSLGREAALAGTAEYAFTNALSQAFLEDRDKNCHVLADIFGGPIDEVSALKTATRVWQRLVAISKARSHLKDYRDLYVRESEVEPYQYKGIISQLVRDCLAPHQRTMNDLEYKSAGLKDMIKTGFSLFVNVSKPRPRDAALMLIYVLGGVTPAEMREVTAAVQSASPDCECRVLVGSSHFASSSDVVSCFRDASSRL